MGKYITKRILITIPVLLGMILLIFFMLNVVPGDPVTVMMKEHLKEDVVESLRQSMHLDDPFFVRFGRVATEDQIGAACGADAVCVLLGERPGLVTAESMSAYMAYRPTVGMAESRRTVLANIHRGGTPPVEAGAHIVELIQLMLEKKASGTDLPV